MFTNVQHVFRPEQMMRFTDPMLKGMLLKMRAPGGSSLTATEWGALLGTRVGATEPDKELAQALLDKDDWYQAAYSWSIVGIAQHVRAVLFATRRLQVLYYTQASESVATVPGGVKSTERKFLLKRLLQEPSMNATDRLIDKHACSNHSNNRSTVCYHKIRWLHCGNRAGCH